VFYSNIVWWNYYDLRLEITLLIGVFDIINSSIYSCKLRQIFLGFSHISDVIWGCFFPPPRLHSVYSDDDEEGNGGGGNGEDRAIHDDIYDDYDGAAERLKEGNSSDAEGNSGKQGNDDEEGDSGDQVAMKKPTVTKKPAAATKSKLAATATSKSAKPAVNNKATKPAGQARTKRKAGQDGDGNQAVGATTGKAA